MIKRIRRLKNLIKTKLINKRLKTAKVRELRYLQVHMLLMIKITHKHIRKTEVILPDSGDERATATTALSPKKRFVIIS